MSVKNPLIGLVLLLGSSSLASAEQYWISVDYGTTAKTANDEEAALVHCSDETFRARLGNANVVFGYPKQGYPLWRGSVMLLSDAQNVDAAYKFLDFIMLPENAALISAFTRYPIGITGAEAFMPADVQTAPEVVIPEASRAAGHFLPTRAGKSMDYITAI